jgi:hypothetical protein
MSIDEIFEAGLETRGVNMVPYWRLRFSGPLQDLDRIFDEIIKVAPLDYGKTDRNAYRNTAGYEYYRPLEGTPTGAEKDTRKRPDVLEMSLCLPTDKEMLTEVIDVIYKFHSYYEPPISLERILRSETKGIDDSDNPNRWWNNSGDWKKNG